MDGSKLTNRAYSATSQMIRSRALRAGDLIVESRLALSLGISRTPLREALQKLEGEGLVVRGSNGALFVRQVGLAEYLQSLKVREVLEAEAVGLAIGRVEPGRIGAARAEIDALISAPTYLTDAHLQSDETVHSLYIDACGNAVLGRMIRSLRAVTCLFEVARLADRMTPDSTEHVEILAAIEAADPRRARKAVQTHMKSLYRFAVENVS